MLKLPIGQLKSKIKVYCSVCGSTHTRILKTNIYENSKEAVEQAKTKLITQSKKFIYAAFVKKIMNEVKK